MKNLFLLLFGLVFLVGCEKENLLEDSQLIPNSYENYDRPFVEISNVSKITCTILSMDLKVYLERIPDSVLYTHFKIEDPFGEITKTSKTNSIILNCRCDKPSEYRISLYNEDLNRETASYLLVVDP